MLIWLKHLGSWIHALKKVNDTPSAQDQLPIYWPGIGTRLVLTDKMRFADASGRCLSVVPHQFWTC